MSTATTFPDHSRAATGRFDFKQMTLDGLWKLAERLDGEPVPGVRMTERQFLDWRPDELRAEWVDGEVILVAPANAAHDTLEIWLTHLLHALLEENDVGELRSDMYVRLTQGPSLRIPDLMFISSEHRARIRDTVIEGPPDVVFEIVSPDSRNRDRRAKYLEYERAGVREYWIVDPLLQSVDCYALHGKSYQAIAEVKGWIRSTVLTSLVLKPAWLSQSPRPKVVLTLKQIRRKRAARK